MAGGEKAKSSGEYGEKIVKNLLEIFGWKNCIIMVQLSRQKSKTFIMN